MLRWAIGYSLRATKPRCAHTRDYARTRLLAHIHLSAPVGTLVVAGTIPSELGLCGDLVMLSLEFNSLSGAPSPKSQIVTQTVTMTVTQAVTQT